MSDYTCTQCANDAEPGDVLCETCLAVEEMERQIGEKFAILTKPLVAALKAEHEAREKAEAKAAQFEADWVAAKYEFGTTTAKLREEKRNGDEAFAKMLNDRNAWRSKCDRISLILNAAGDQDGSEAEQNRAALVCIADVIGVPF